MKPMPDLSAFAAECHEISRSKGWTDIPRPEAQMINLMVSENSEALEEFREHRGMTEIYYTCTRQDGSYFTVGAAHHSPTDKPCGIPIELADTVIRIGQHCGTEGLDLAKAAAEVRDDVFARTDFNEAIADATFFLSWAWIGTRRGKLLANSFLGARTVMDIVDGRVELALARALWSIALFCESAEIDLWAVVEEKMAFNRTRPALHGGKKC
jgi:hypothetical protein